MKIVGFPRATALALIGLFLLPALAVAQKRYIAFGDSITFGTGDATSRPVSEMGYPGRLDDLLAARGITATIINAGLPAEATPEAVSRIDRVLRTTPADVLLLMEGTNDIGLQVSVETATFNLNRIAEKAENQGLQVVHASIIPRLPSANRDADNKIAAELAGTLRDLAWDKNRGFADPFEVFFWQTANFATLYIGGIDKLHPNAAGYDKLAEVFADVISETDKVPPVIGAFAPPNGAKEVSADATIHLSLYDFGKGIDLPSTRLVINGQEVGALVAGDMQKADIDFRPTNPLVGVVSVSYRSRDLANPANSVDRPLTRFIIAGTKFLTGDINEDGRVDGQDLIALALSFGARRGDPRFLRAADFDTNDIIDGVDLAALATNFGQKSF